MPTWNNVSANFGDAASLANSAQQGMSSAGTIFGRITDQLRQREKMVLDNAYRDKAYDESVRQYEKTFGENARQFDERMAQNASQFDATQALKREEMALNAALQREQIAASRANAAASNSLARQRFNWEQQRYNEGQELATIQSAVQMAVTGDEESAKQILANVDPNNRYGRNAQAILNNWGAVEGLRTNAQAGTLGATEDSVNRLLALGGLGDMASLTKNQSTRQTRAKEATEKRNEAVRNSASQARTRLNGENWKPANARLAINMTNNLSEELKKYNVDLDQNAFVELCEAYGIDDNILTSRALTSDEFRGAVIAGLRNGSLTVGNRALNNQQLLALDNSLSLEGMIKSNLTYQRQQQALQQRRQAEERAASARANENRIAEAIPY